MTKPCFVFVENNGDIDLDSTSATADGVRFEVLKNSMGWRFDNPDRYSQDEEWERLLGYGKVVPAVLVLADD